MKRWHVLVVYLVLGPPLGGLVFFVSFALGFMVVSAPATTGDAVEQLVPSMQTLRGLPYVLLASYPAGLPAAFAAGVAHALLLGRLSPLPLVGIVCLAGLGANASLLGPADLRWPWTVIAFTAGLPALVSAAILSAGLCRLAGPRG